MTHRFFDMLHKLTALLLDSTPLLDVKQQTHSADGHQRVIKPCRCVIKESSDKFRLSDNFSTPPHASRVFGIIMRQT